MVADYGYEFTFNKNLQQKGSLHAKQQELEQLQHLQEQQTIGLLKATSAAEKQRWKELVEKNRVAMDLLASEIAMLQATESSHMQLLHDRNAARLRNMCASNGGLYIKLGADSHLP